MNPKEFIGNMVNILAPRVPSDWQEFKQKVIDGEIKSVPTYGLGDALILEYYGKNKKKVEQGRFRLPLHGNEQEISYHVSRDPDGSFSVIREGIYPYQG